MRVAVIGAGYFAGFQIGAWAEMPDTELIAVVDPDPQARLRAVRIAPEAQIVEHLDAVLALDPDIVDIAAPPGAHLDLIQTLCGEVPTIICQKPFCGDIAAAREAVEIARSRGTLLVVHENFRFQPWYRQIAALIRDGTLGDVRQARFALRPGDGRGPRAYLDRQPYFQSMQRFLIHETAIHFLDTFRYLFGEPISVFADLWRANPAIKGEDCGIFVLQTATGARLMFDGNRTLDHVADNPRLTMGEFEVEGTDASLRLSGDGRLTVRPFGAADWRDVPVAFDADAFGGGCVRALQQHVVDAIRRGVAPENTGRDYLINLELEDLVYRSAIEGRKLAVEVGG